MNLTKRVMSRMTYAALVLPLFLFLGCGLPSGEEKDFAAAYEFVRDNLDKDNWDYLNSDSVLKARLNADIRLAIGTSRARLRNDSLPREVFYEYLLAPSIDTERFDDWRKTCLSSFSCLQSDTSSVATVLDSLNLILRRQFTFQNSRIEKEHNWSTYQDGNMRGTCWDMATIVLFPLRALGYAATIDFIPAWGNADGRHSWNSVYVNGKMVPFMGMEGNVNSYNPFGVREVADSPEKRSYRRPAKVFRVTFSDNETYRRIKDKYPSLGHLPIFSQLKFKDVTSEYFSVSDLIVKRPQDYLGDILFLSVFSGGRWVETCVAEVSGEDCFIFADMNKEMLYLLVRPDGMTAEVPWIFNKDGEVSELRPDFQDTGDMEISHLLLPIMEYYYRKPPEENRIYRLYTYLSKWIVVGEARSGMDKILFRDVPEGGLFMLTDESNMPVGRPFTYHGKMCQWW